MTSPLIEALRFGPDPMQADPRGMGRDQASFPSFGAMMSDPGFRGDWGKVGAMMSPGISFARDMITGNDPIQGGFGMGAANTGMNMAGGTPNPELMGRNDFSQLDLAGQISAAEAPGMGADPMGGGVGVNAADLGADPNAPGMFAQGGMVRPQDLAGPNPPGPDQGYVGVHAGEMILNQPQQMALIQALRGRR